MRLLFTVCACLWLISCNSEASVKQVMQGYITALEEKRYDDAYTYLTSKDREYLARGLYRQMMQVSNIFSDMMNLPGARYSIEHIEVFPQEAGKPLTATAAVEMTHPDPEKVIEQRINDAADILLGAPQDKASPPADKTVPMVTESVIYYLVEEADGWKVELPQ